MANKGKTFEDFVGEIVDNGDTVYASPWLDEHYWTVAASAGSVITSKLEFKNKVQKRRYKDREDVVHVPNLKTALASYRFDGEFLAPPGRKLRQDMDQSEIEDILAREAELSDMAVKMMGSLFTPTSSGTTLLGTTTFPEIWIMSTKRP